MYECNCFLWVQGTSDNVDNIIKFIENHTAQTHSGIIVDFISEETSAISLDTYCGEVGTRFSEDLLDLHTALKGEFNTGIVGHYILDDVHKFELVGDAIKDADMSWLADYSTEQINELHDIAKKKFNKKGNKETCVQVAG